MKLHLVLLVTVAVLLSGCVTYVYRVVQPSGVPEPVTKTAVTLPYDPLEYHLVSSHDRLSITISNPTDDRISLVGYRSFVVIPTGESRPLRGHVLAPHSFVQMSLPPIPVTVAYPDYYWGWGWGWRWGPGWYDPFWGPYYPVPTVSYARVMTPFDWKWETGVIRLRLTYERNTNWFEQNFEIAREQAK